MSKKEKSNFLMQGSILAVASLVSRVIGLLYRVPLTNILGNQGNSFYSCAYEIYSMMLLISSYSLPLAVSKVVSAYRSKGERKNAFRVFRCALVFAMISGFLATIIIFIGAGAFTKMMSTPLSIYALKVLAPGLFIVAVLGVMRGFFQGFGTMVPSAISQIIEQIINAIMSVWAAYTFYHYGMKIGGVLGNEELYGAAYGAAGGTLGTVSGAAAGLLFMIFLYKIYKPNLKKQIKRDTTRRKESYRYIFKMIFLTIVPVLMSTAIYNISSIIDQGLYKGIAQRLGESSLVVDDAWGSFSGRYKTLINVPLAIASSLAASCVPSLTAAYTQKNRKLVNKRIDSSMRFIMIIAFPCAVGLGVLADPILHLLHLADKTSDMPQQMLRVGAVSVIFYSISTLSNGLLQGISRMKAPVRNAAIALVLHIILLVVLMYATNLGIFSVIWANTAFAFFMCILNASALRRYAGYHQEVRKTFVIPGIAAMIMGVFVYVLYRVLFSLIPINTIVTILDVGLGAVVYLLMLIALKGLEEEDLLGFPKGHKIVALLHKLHLLK